MRRGPDCSGPDGTLRTPRYDWGFPARQIGRFSGSHILIGIDFSSFKTSVFGTILLLYEWIVPLGFYVEI